MEAPRGCWGAGGRPVLRYAGPGKCGRRDGRRGGVNRSPGAIRMARDVSKRWAGADRFQARFAARISAAIYNVALLGEGSPPPLPPLDTTGSRDRRWEAPIGLRWRPATTGCRARKRFRGPYVKRPLDSARMAAAENWGAARTSPHAESNRNRPVERRIADSLRLCSLLARARRCVGCVSDAAKPPGAATVSPPPRLFLYGFWYCFAQTCNIVFYFVRIGDVVRFRFWFSPQSAFQMPRNGNPVRKTGRAREKNLLKAKRSFPWPPPKDPRTGANLIYPIAP